MIKKITVLFILSFVLSCSNDDDFDNKSTDVELTIGNSIFVNNEQILVSGIKNSNNNFSTEFWIDNISTDSITFANSLKINDVYRGSIDNLYRTTFINKKNNYDANLYSFHQGALMPDGNILFYKNNNPITTNIPNPGVLSAISFFNEQPFYSGHISEEIFTETGPIFVPNIPFFWDGNSPIVELPIPEELFFRGTSCLFVDLDDFYVGGKTSFPMYWKNTEMIKLGELFGEVNQIYLAGENIYAVGFYNKNDSNSTGHTACYWKNGELFELDDNAQANDIFIDENDIYICGSTGNVPAEYNACYWKNGIRVDLPK
jgi:hypothetical protein